MSTQLFVANLPHGANEAILRMAFSQNGRKVTSVEIVVDATKRWARGIAYVDMATDADARAAIRAMDGSDLDGCALRVNEGKSRA